MESIIERNKRIGADVKRAAFMVKQQQSYEFKKKYAAIRAREFVGMCDEHDKNYHVSVGGLDSITLFLFLHSIGIYCPGVSASYLEDRGNQAVHKALGIISVSPIKRENGKPWTKSAVIQEFGFPVLSKEIAAKIELLQNPTENNATVSRGKCFCGERHGARRHECNPERNLDCTPLYGTKRYWITEKYND